jgi:hypothetical protein
MAHKQPLKLSKKTHQMLAMNSHCDIPGMNLQQMSFDPKGGF